MKIGPSTASVSASPPSKAKLIPTFYDLCKTSNEKVAVVTDIRGGEMFNNLIEVLDKCYKEITGCNFKITALHAGVECAQFVKANKELQLISIGPTIEHPHSIDECLDIEGTNQIFSTVCRALAIL